MAIPEKVLIENKSLKDIFKPDFLNTISNSSGEIFPVNVMFIHESEQDGNKQAFPVILSHGNNQEVIDKKLHLESPNEKVLKKFIKALETTKND